MAIFKSIIPVQYDPDENIQRGNWGHRLDFLFSCVGYAVGLGNIWRFPYLCYQNGGGAFLIPYVIMLGIAGLPLLFFEVCLGQFANLGPISIWNISPFFKGIGWGMVIISAFICMYYNVIIAWGFYYLFASFTSKLPWSDCLNSFNDVRCRQLGVNVTNQTNVPGNARFNQFPLECTKDIKTNCTNYQTPAEQYWERVVLGLVDATTGKQRFLDQSIGEVQWHLSLCLLLAWLLVFVCLVNGIKTSGKIVYFTALFPYVVLFILMINGSLLPGAREGIIYYITPQWNMLKKASVWGAAATQIFFSLGVTLGGLLTMASYNRFRHNCYRDALLVAIINSLTSVFGGFVIFSVMGYLAHRTGVPIDKVAKTGPGLAFIAYPEGVASMPGAPFWSCLFFIMLILLGLDSQFAMVETVVSGLIDEFPVLSKTFKHKFAFMTIFCIFMYFVGLLMVCKGGIYVLTLIETYSASYSLLLISFLEMVVIVYVYGIQNFLKDIHMMLGFQPGPYWKSCWTVISPLAIFFIFIFLCVQYQGVKYGSYEFPPFFQALGWIIVLLPILAIFICMGLELYKNDIMQVLKKSCQPHAKWGPCVEKFWADDPRYREKLEALPPVSAD